MRTGIFTHVTMEANVGRVESLIDPFAARALFQRARPFSQSLTYSPRSTSFKAFGNGLRGDHLSVFDDHHRNEPSAAM